MSSNTGRQGHGRRKDGPTQDEANALAAGGMTLHSLGRQRDRMLIVQTACLMAMEGMTRGRGLEISERALEEYGLRVSPSKVGLVLSALKIGTVTSQGRRSYVLDKSQLHSIQGRLSDEIDRMAPRVEETITQFGDVVERVEALDERLRTTILLANREQEVRQYLRDNSRRLQQVEAREREYRRLRESMERLNKLEAACHDLEGRVESLPSLEGRKKELEESLRLHEIEVKETVEGESALAQRIADLKSRASWVSLAQLTGEIEEGKKELEELKEQLGEKRSLVAKLFGKKAGGDQQ